MSRGTTHRTIRIPDEVWQPALAVAEREGDTLSEIVRRALIAYTAAHTTTEEGTAS